jgi:hypothetical protein
MNRIYHPWDKWECYKCGFFNSSKLGMTKEEGEEAYSKFFKNLDSFETGMNRVFREWPNSCEHNLTNISLNRVAWLGQAAACIQEGLVSDYRAGFSLLSDQEQREANSLALKHLYIWLKTHNYDLPDNNDISIRNNIFTEDSYE